MYELDRRLVVARLRRGRRLKAERGGFAGGGVRYGFTTERKQLVPRPAEREVAKRGGAWHPTTPTPLRTGRRLRSLRRWGGWSVRRLRALPAVRIGSP